MCSRIASTAASGSPAAITSVRVRWVIACATSSSGESVWIVARRKLLIRPRMCRGDLDQDGVVGLLPQPLVEAVVEVENGRGVAAPRGGHHPVGQAQEVALDPGRPPLGHAPHHEALEQHAHARDLRDGDRRQLGHAGAAARKANDEPFVLELGERLAHGDMAYTEVSRECPLDEPVARGVLALVDRLRAGDLRPHRPGSDLEGAGAATASSCQMQTLSDRSPRGAPASPAGYSDRRPSVTEEGRRPVVQICRFRRSAPSTRGERAPCSCCLLGDPGATRQAAPLDLLGTASGCSQPGAGSPPDGHAPAPRPDTRWPGRRGCRDVHSCLHLLSHLLRNDRVWTCSCPPMSGLELTNERGR